MAELKLLRGEIALVDDNLYPALSRHVWHRHSNGYVVRTTGTHKKRKVHWLHRIVLGIDSDADHRDGNKLDNRRSNLRPATGSQNGGNRRKTSIIETSSRFKGVTLKPANKKWNKDKWRAQIKVNNKTGKQITLGYFDTEIDAAKAYNKAAKELFGEFALLNPI